MAGCRRGRSSNDIRATFTHGTRVRVRVRVWSIRCGPNKPLVMMKLLVNQAYENMGLRTTQMIGTLFDGIARHTPEGVAWRELALLQGVKTTLAERDGPFGDYGSRKKT